MLEAMTYQDMLSDINKNARKNGIINDTIGILITRPDLPTGKQIMNSLEYFHFRTGKSAAKSQRPGANPARRPAGYRGNPPRDWRCTRAGSDDRNRTV